MQEVDSNFGKELDALFGNNNYDFSYTEYGEHGVMIAYPEKVYACCFSGTLRLGELIEKNTYDGQRAASRKNKILYVELLHIRSNKPLYVFNYHMPLCNLKQQQMLLHTKVLVELVKKTAQDWPLFLCTDFNNRPGSRPYKYITTHLSDSRNRNYSPSVNVIDKQGNNFRGCLDYIFYGGNVRIRRSIVIPAKEVIPSNKHGSDHTPLIICFTL